MSQINFVPPKVAISDPRTGLITREWYLFLLSMFERVGGSSGTSTTDLTLSQFEDAGIEETKAFLFRLADQTQSMPVVELMQIDSQENRYFALEAEVAILRRQIDDIRLGTNL
jgi:hypothetical protein